MVTSTAQVAPAERRAQYEAAITTLQAAGQPVTAEAVWRIAGGRRGNVQNFVRAWKAAQAGSPVLEPLPTVVEAAPAPVPAEAPAAIQTTPPPPPPVSRLQALLAQVAQLDEDWREMERTQHQLAAQRAQAHADYRNSLIEAARLTRQVRQLQQQATSPAFLMQADALATVERVRQQLSAVVGQADADRVRADPDYRPWWLEGT